MAGTLPPRVYGTVVAVTTTATSLDNVAGWIPRARSRQGLPFEGNSSRAGSSRRPASRSRGEGGVRAKKLKRARVGPRLAPARVRPRARRASPRRSDGRGSRTHVRSRDGDPSRRGRASVTWSSPRPPQEGASAIASSSTICRSSCPAGIVGVIGPNGAGKTTSSRMLVGQEKPDGGTLKDRRDGADLVRRSVARRARRRQVGLRRHQRRRADDRGGQGPRGELARMLVVQLPRLRSAEEGEGPRAASATACILARLLSEGGNRSSRRADQRPRRRDAASARVGAPQLPRLRRRHEPRSLVPRPHRDPHALRWRSRARHNVTFFDGNYQAYERTVRSALEAR